MVNSRRPLEEKISLFWHGMFATGFSKLNCAGPIVEQVSMFRRLGLGDFRSILGMVARDPAMIYWLDNHENTRANPNENFGRELLELFTLGVGNYDELDVKACARAFSGWSMLETVPSDLPYGRFDWEFEYRPDQHDDTEKQFLGAQGRLDGDDVLDEILRQPAAAVFLSNRLCRFFLADQPDEEDVLDVAEVCRATEFEIRQILRSLFLSARFRSGKYFASRVKSPVEFVVGLLRLTGTLSSIEPSIHDVLRSCRSMGQELLDPPTVEGWHGGAEWLNTASLVERANFAAAQFESEGGASPRDLYARIEADASTTPATLLDLCIGWLTMPCLLDDTRATLTDFIATDPRNRNQPGQTVDRWRPLVKDVLSLLAASPEYQLA